MATRQDLQNLITSWFTLQTPKPQQTSWVSVSMDTNIWDIINSESTEKRNMKISDQMNKLLQKHQTRLNIAKWKVSSGDKRMDKLEDARSSLADYARSAYLEEAKKDSSMDLWVLDNMKDWDIIDWMTKDDPVAKQKFVNFVNNWWFVKDVYNDIMWIDEEAIREQERKDAGWFKNFIWAAGIEVPKQLWNLIDMTWLWAKLRQSDIDRLEKYNEVSSDEYDKFKKWEITFDELKDKWVSWIYLDYEEDVKNGNFRWSIEEYWKQMYEKWMDDVNSSMADQLLENYAINYDPEWKWAGAWKFATQLAEFAMLPWSKWNFIKNTLLGTAEILWLNILSEWKLPTKWEAATTAWVTAAIEWILRIPWWVKLLRWIIGKTSPEVKEALWNMTRKDRKELGDISKQWLSAAKKKWTEILEKAATWIRKKIWEAWEKLWDIRKNMEGNFTYKDLFYELNSQFNKFVKEWWGKWKTPQIKIKPDWKLVIRNEDALSNVTDSEWVKLLDYIKSERNAFMEQWRKWDIKDVERFMQDLNDKIYRAIDIWKINRADSGVKALLDGIKWAYEKLYSRMWPVAWPAFKKAKEEFSNMDNYAKFFEKYIWKLKEWKKWTQALNELEKEMQLWEKGFSKWQDYIWEFLKILKSENIIEEDLGSQLISLIYSFWIKNPKQLQELIETIYPSVPWVRELWLSILRRWMKSSEAETMLKDAVPWKLDIWESINNAIRPVTQVWEERMLEY